MDETSSWHRLWRYVVGIAVCLVFGWFAFVRGTRVPLLGLVDLGFHELGHLITYVFPDAVTAVMGSVTQVLVPLGLAAYFLLVRGDLLGAGVCSAWAGASAADVSVYIADAPYERLPLIGGEHDWAFLLGPEQLDMLAGAHTLAAVAKGLGVLLLLAGLVLCAAGIVRGRRRDTPLVRQVSASEMWR